MKTKIALLLLAASTLIIAASAQNKTPVNKLTRAEKAAGWTLLFDGKTLNGWRGFHSDKVPAGWAIEDGCIKKVPAQGELGQAGGDLITVDQFDNFEFSVEWKLSKGAVKYWNRSVVPSHMANDHASAPTVKMALKPSAIHGSQPATK